MKKLYRSKKNKVLAGVCGGFGDYMNLDPVLVRVIFVLLVLVTGFFPGLLAYIIAWLIIPEQ